MANFGILAKMGVDSSKLISGLKTAGDKAAGFGKKLGTVVKAGAVAAGAAISAMAVKGVKDFIDFEKKMAEVFTLLPESSAEAEKKMSGDMRKLATTMGIDVIDATGALYQAISAGVPKENAADFLMVASKAAIAGVSDLETSVAALTTIINGYSMEMDEATRVSDVLFSTVKIGVTNFTELGQNIGKVTPLAAELGISIEEVGGMFAVLTKNLGAGKTAEAGTAIRSMLAELSKEGMKAFENFVEATGTTFPNFIRSGGSVADALKQMTVHAEASGKGLMDMFRGVEAGMGALTLAKNKSEDLSVAVKAIKDDAGSAEKAFQIMAKTTAKAWDDMAAGAKELGMTLGELLLPIVQTVIEAATGAFESLAQTIKDVTKWVAENPGLWKDMGKAIMTAVVAIGLYNAAAVLSAIKTGVMTAALVIYRTTIGGAIAGMKALALAMSTNVFTAIVAAVGAVVTAFVLWGDSTEEAAKQAREAAEGFADKWNEKAEQAVKATKKLEDEYVKLVQELQALRRERELAEGGDLTATQTSLTLAKEKLKIMKDDLALAQAKPKAIEALMDAEARRFAEVMRGITSETDALMITAAHNANIKIHKQNIQEAQNEILKLTIAEETQRNLIKRLTKEAADEEERRLQSLKQAHELIEAVRREHELSQTEMGKIVLATDRLNALDRERAQILADLNAGNKGDLDTVKRLGEIEKDRLKTQKEIADIMKGELNKLRKEEIGLLEEGQGLLEKELAGVEKIIAAEERKLEVIQAQLDAQDQKVLAAEKEAAAAMAGFEAQKFDFVTGEGKGVGEFNLSSANLRREFRRLKAAGQLPEGVKTLRDFQKHVEDNIRKKQDDLAKEKKKQKDLQDARDKADKAKQAAEEKAVALRKEIQAEEMKIIKLRDALNDKEKKTLKEITAERIRLEAALLKFRAMAVGAQIPVAPGLDAVMAGLGIKLDAVTVAVGNAATTTTDAMRDYGAGGKYDPMTGELWEKTETELVALNTTALDQVNLLEGFFINQ